MRTLFAWAVLMAAKALVGGAGPETDLAPQPNRLLLLFAPPEDVLLSHEGRKEETRCMVAAQEGGSLRRQLILSQSAGAGQRGGANEGDGPAVMSEQWFSSSISIRRGGKTKEKYMAIMRGGGRNDEEWRRGALAGCSLSTIGLPARTEKQTLRIFWSKSSVSIG